MKNTYPDTLILPEHEMPGAPPTPTEFKHDGYDVAGRPLLVADDGSEWVITERRS